MLNHKGTRTIATERLLLRPFILEDAPDMYKNWTSDPHVAKYVSWKPHASVDETANLLELWTSRYVDADYYNWAMTLDGHAIGNIEVVGKSNKHESVELGYCMSADHWNRGYMTEAVSAIRDFLFREVGVYRLVIRHMTQNPASGKVARKCGCTWEGCHRSEIISQSGEHTNIEVYSLLRPEWEEMQKTIKPQVLTLDTPRLTLRPACIGDFEAVHAYAGSPENTHYMAWGPNDEKQTREYLVNCEKEWSCQPVKNYEFVMVQKETGKVIGGCGLFLGEGGTQANFGWILHRDYWKQGYTPEAARAMRDYAFGTLGVHRVYTTCDGENYGSYRVMEKIGMRREAEFRQARMCHGEWHDEYQYGMLKKEWETAREAQPQSIILNTPRLTLRPACTNDLSDVCAYSCDPENTYYMMSGTSDKKCTLRYLQNCEKAWKCQPLTDYKFSIVLKETDRVIGGCRLHISDDNTQATLGWILHRDYWRQGLMTEAVREVIEYAFGTLGLHRLRATCDAENYGSWRVMEKLGMRKEAEFRSVRLCHGERHDEYEYAILKEEWEIRREIAYYSALPCRFDEFADLPVLTDGVIELVCTEKRPAIPEKKHVPSYEFNICKDGEVIGHLGLRIGYPAGLYYGGQIGYSIFEAHRGNGYAVRACRLAAKVARFHEMEKLLITNNVTNTASRRVCEKLGARHLRTVRLPEWTELYQSGQRYTNVFEYDITDVPSI